MVEDQVFQLNMFNKLSCFRLALEDDQFLDNRRDNDLETVGWRVLRFNTTHIREKMEKYCLPTVVDNINRLGGAEEGQLAGRRFDLDAPRGYQQLLLDDF